MTEEERAERRAQMLKCLEISVDIWNLLADAVAAGEDSLHIDRVKDLIRTRFAAPIHKSRLDAVGYSIVQAMNRYDLTSCGIWSLAHNMDHCLFEDDLSQIEAALARAEP